MSLHTPCLIHVSQWNLRMDGLFIYALFPVLRKYVNDCLFGLFSVNSYNIFQFGCLHFISAGDLLGREE